MKKLLVIALVMLQVCQTYANTLGTEENVYLYYYKPKGIGTSGSNLPSKGPAHTQVKVFYDKEENTLCIKNTQGINVELYIYGSNDQLLLSASCNEANATIDVSNLSNGEYYIFVVTNGNVFKGDININNTLR